MSQNILSFVLKYTVQYHRDYLYLHKFLLLYNIIFIMRFIYILLLLIFQIVTVWAQISDPQKRDITLTILNKRGRPINNIFVKSIESGNAGVTDSKGLYVFKNMTDDDSISVLLPKYGQTLIPVVDMDSIVVTLRSARLYSYENSEGNRSIVKKEAKQGNDLVDVPELVKRCSCTSLFELLNGNIPGLVMGNG